MKSNLLLKTFYILLFVLITGEGFTQRLANISLSAYAPVKHDSAAVANNTYLKDVIPAPVAEPWKEWKTVENHTFGKDRGNIPMIVDLHSLHPYFRDKITLLIQKCHEKGIELAVVESYRTHAKQSEYFSMGRKYTRSAGGKSKHQYGLAVDVVPMINGVAQWDNTKLWLKVGVEGEKLGLRWGGRWKSPYDPAHFEWSGGLTTYQLAAGQLPKIPSVFTDKYPCIESDISELREHWNKWEADQEALKNQQRLSAN